MSATMTITTTQDLLNQLYQPGIVPGYTKCFVMGCYADAQVGRLHKHMGPVDACHDHDPERQMYARPFGVLVEEPTDVETPDDGDEAPKTTEEIVAAMMKEIIRLSSDKGQDDNGGKKSKLRKPRPVVPPSGATAVRGF